MTRSLPSLAVVAVIAATGALAGPATAATPGKRAATHVKAPATVAKITGAPLDGRPGMATGAECRAYAAAADAVLDQVEQSIIDGTDVGYDAGAVVDGILGAGQARGCAFMA